MKVPTMGDSITEGTIVEWTAQVGQMVKEGDVVALIETDKVTVDIKAEIDGVLTQCFGELEETVEVGAQLYELDTEAEATVAASEDSAAPAAAAAAAPTPAASAAPASAAPVAAKQAPTSRVPSIQFLGKDGWALKLSGADARVVYVPKNFGRPVFSEDEMDALVMGGANIAPEVKEHSHGAIFG
eukprot:CAMPEP_0113601900 /NCGR_PEP_ID=MMETSP0017_2-20120614/472_1 /TAXON_ID=2856 /ORGANISM="Cylindrotheca closterium" /LENGTH=184 /DNA_ID=CAMNT_0000510217 /DNA_START=137 /DNA_END=691 /DNA_ORIENTATION=+ /assembly_acc=CAM_ASM_000147